MHDLTQEELRILRPLTSPRKVQDFIETIPINFEPEGDTCLSPRRVLRERRAHCIEAAMLAAAALQLHGHSPLLVDLEAAPSDDSHVIAVFRQGRHWGAISKSNHSVLRYREPVYATLRELVMSYFHEYTDQAGRKTLRSFSRPINLKRFENEGWMTSEDDLWQVANALVDAPHTKLLNRTHISSLRRADQIEQEAGRLLQWKSK